MQSQLESSGSIETLSTVIIRRSSGLARHLWPMSRSENSYASKIFSRSSFQATATVHSSIFGTTLQPFGAEWRPAGGGGFCPASSRALRSCLSNSGPLPRFFAKVSQSSSVKTRCAPGWIN